MRKTVLAASGSGLRPARSPHSGSLARAASPCSFACPVPVPATPRLALRSVQLLAPESSAPSFRLRSSCLGDARPLGAVSDPQAYRSPPRSPPPLAASNARSPSDAPGRRRNDLVRLLRTARRRRSPERPTVTAASLDCSPASSPAVSRSRISLALDLATVARFASQTRFALAR